MEGLGVKAELDVERPWGVRSGCTHGDGERIKEI